MRGFYFSIIHEPLLHFSVLGLSLFLVYSWLNPYGEPGHTIVVEQSLQRELQDKFHKLNNRIPGDEEMRQLVDAWMQDELLYREGINRGLDRSDKSVRELVISRMRSVVLSDADIDAPDEPTLRAWYEQHKQRYQIAEKLNFSHVSIAGDTPAAKAEAASMRRILERGGDIRHTGKRLQVYVHRSREHTARLFGEDFITSLLSLPVGKWGIISSIRGLHIIRLDAVHPAHLPSFESIRQKLVQDWTVERRREFFRNQIDEMRQSYRIKYPDKPV